MMIYEQSSSNCQLFDIMSNVSLKNTGHTILEKTKTWRRNSENFEIHKSTDASVILGNVLNGFVNLFSNTLTYMMQIFLIFKEMAPCASKYEYKWTYVLYTTQLLNVLSFLRITNFLTECFFQLDTYIQYI